MKHFIPHDYQQHAIDEMAVSPILALFMDPGCGKTAVVLSHLKSQRPLKTLLIAPLDVIYRVWPRETAKWSQFADITYTFLHGENKEQALREDKDIYLINPEGLKWFNSAVRRAKLWKFKILVVDESTIFKNFKSLRFANHLTPMLGAFKQRYILSGTPVTKTYLDLWSQYYILDLGKRLTDNYYEYRSKYFYQTDKRGFNYALHPGYEEKVKELVKDITIHVSASDHLELPDIIINDILVNMTNIERKMYRSMAKDLLVKFTDGSVVSAANAAVKTGKLQCIANGFLYLTGVNQTTGKNEIVGSKDIHTHKLDALQSLIEELNGNPILIGYHYRRDLEDLLKRFPGTPYFGSGASMEHKIKIENDWNAGNIPVLFAQIHSTARGLNLQQSGYHIAFYSMIWSFEDYDQFIQRVARQGQKASRVFVHRIICQNTIDEFIVETIENRKEQSNDFLFSLKKHLLTTSNI